MAARGRRRVSEGRRRERRLRDLANFARFLQLDLVRAYCALGDASSVDDFRQLDGAWRAADAPCAIKLSRDASSTPSSRRLCTHRDELWSRARLTD